MTGKKIAGVFGTQNVGKTTFVRDLVDATEGRQESWKVFGSDYRKEIGRQGLSINRNGTEESQMTIHGILLQNVVDAVSDMKCDRIIMDRTPVDSYAYTMWHNRFGNGKISDETLNMMEQQVFRFCRMFDYLFYIPLDKCEDVEVVDDKFRDTNLEYRKQIDMIMGELYNRLSATGVLSNVFVMCLFGSRQKRVDRFLHYVCKEGVK